MTRRRAPERPQNKGMQLTGGAIFQVAAPPAADAQCSTDLPNTMRATSVTSRSPSATWRRSVAAVFATSVPAGVLMVAIESWRHFAWVPFLVAVGGPYLVMIGHLNLSPELSSSEKAAWRRELWWGHRALPAIWTYLLATDLHEASRDFVESPREWWRP